MRSGFLVWLAVPALLACGGCPTGDMYVAGNARARVTTSQGEFVIELLAAQAPRTVDNFRQYADEGFYDGTIFHRVIARFVIQGGGYTPTLELKATRDPVANEGYNGLRNVRGTVAMARTDNPDSATAQFFINLADNAPLDATLHSPGYAVFGRVAEGMDVVDRIAAVATGPRGELQDVPLTDVVIQSVRIEPGPDVLSPTWQNYLDNYRYNAQVTLRKMVVDLLGTLLSHAGRG